MGTHDAERRVLGVPPPQGQQDQATDSLAVSEASASFLAGLSHPSYLPLFRAGPVALLSWGPLGSAVLGAWACLKTRGFPWPRQCSGRRAHSPCCVAATTSSCSPAPAPSLEPAVTPAPRSPAPATSSLGLCRPRGSCPLPGLSHCSRPGVSCLCRDEGQSTLQWTTFCFLLPRGQAGCCPAPSCCGRCCRM